MHLLSQALTTRDHEPGSSRSARRSLLHLMPKCSKSHPKRENTYSTRHDSSSGHRRRARTCAIMNLQRGHLSRLPRLPKWTGWKARHPATNRCDVRCDDELDVLCVRVMICMSVCSLSAHVRRRIHVLEGGVMAAALRCIGYLIECVLYR